jgi:hypothetical protein
MYHIAYNTHVWKCCLDVQACFLAPFGTWAIGPGDRLPTPIVPPSCVQTDRVSYWYFGTYSGGFSFCVMHSSLILRSRTCLFRPSPGRRRPSVIPVLYRRYAGVYPRLIAKNLAVIGFAPPFGAFWVYFAYSPAQNQVCAGVGQVRRCVTCLTLRFLAEGEVFFALVFFRLGARSRVNHLRNLQPPFSNAHCSRMVGCGYHLAGCAHALALSGRALNPGS